MEGQPSLFDNSEIEDVPEIAWALIVRPGTEIDSIPDILLAENANGYLTLPGGKANTDETPITTIIRETYEETGIDVPEDYCIELKPRYFKSYKGANYMATPFVIFHFADLHDPRDTEPNKLGPWRWTPLGQIKKLILNGSLPPQILEDEAVEHITQMVADYFYENEFSPSGILDECLDLRELEILSRIRRNLLSC